MVKEWLLPWLDTQWDNGSHIPQDKPDSAGGERGGWAGISGNSGPRLPSGF